MVDAFSESKGTSKEKQRSRIYLGLLALITAMYCIWVLSLPLFPTVDGPVHLYYVHVLQALLLKQPSIYKHFYYIKHILPPYSLYYYTLMFLMKIFPALLADKIIICCYFVSFVFGFRYLAMALGPSGELMAFLSPLLLLNWPLGMGFVNFCFATSFAFWAVGLWFRAAGKPEHRKKIAFVLLAYGTMLTHPVPLLFILGICFAEIAVRFVLHFKNPATSRDSFLKKYFIEDAIYLLLATGTIFYVKLFTESNVLHQLAPEKITIHTIADNAWTYLFQQSLDMFQGSSISMRFYQFSLYVILVVPILLAAGYVFKNWGEISWTLGHTWLLLSIFMILGLPFVPLNINGSQFFAHRLILFVWISAMACGSVYRIRNSRFAMRVLIFSVFSNTWILGMANARIRPVAEDISRVEKIPLSSTNQVGLTLNQEEYLKVRTLNYDPYNWASVHYFRRSDAVLFNSPWMQSSAIIPLGALPTMPNKEVGFVALERPSLLRSDMKESEAKQAYIFSNIDFVFINRSVDSRPWKPDLILASPLIGQRNWSCGFYGWYSLCNHTDLH